LIVDPSSDNPRTAAEQPKLDIDLEDYESLF
jgi:hypothetical protein